ncbi:MAG TPA: hypothetical protein VFV08_07985, partial [Puia sp.]|nr:hypothetical protein [Puia sp.]
MLRRLLIGAFYLSFCLLMITTIKAQAPDTTHPVAADTTHPTTKDTTHLAQADTTHPVSVDPEL